MSVMNVGRTTKAWSDAPQQSALKSDGSRFSSAQELARMPKDKDLGQVLNEVADPNYVDPAKTRRVGNQDLDKDAFFKLMLAQIRAQDPTNPLQSHEMASHLAQFTSLEQLYNINSGIEGLTKNQSPNSNFQVLNFMGKSVSADTSKVYRVKGDKAHEVRFEVGGEGTVTTTVEILDATNKAVRKIQMGPLKKGENTVTWNGLGDDGLPTRAGEYRVRIESKDANGKKIAVKTAFSGTISGVNFTPQGPLLMVGNQAIRLSEISKIEDETLKNQAVAAQTASQPAAGQPRPQAPIATQVPAAPRPAPASVPAAEDPVPNDMQSVNLDPRLLEKQLGETVSPPGGPI